MLSTGRCGTRLLTEILRTSPHLDVEHQPRPELVYPGRLAYEAAAEQSAAWDLAALAARYEHVRSSYLDGAQYVETNNRVTFFAPHLARVFRRSRFIHVTRHPGAFVRSGLRRRYYQGAPHDEGRIVPTHGDPLAAGWEGLPQPLKIGWLWNATNAFIEDFKQSVAPARVLTVRGEDLFTDVAATVEIFAFLETQPPPERVIRRLIARPLNTQREGAWPPFEQWPETEREQLAAVVPLASRYGYRM